ncbi:MAG: hypothetical protein ACM3PP_13875 [Candidatus Saccharibacteria bacterium]
MILKRTLLVIIAVLLLVAGPLSCAPVEDQKEVLAFVDRYYDVLRNGDYEKLTFYYYSGFYDNLPQEQWLARLKSYDEKYGIVTEHKLSSRNVDYTSGYVSGQLYYNLTYDVKRQNGSTVDQLVVRKAGQQVEIISHQITVNE